MSRWFRHYAGMMRDDKLVRASIKSKQSVERVCWVWCAILESAAEIDDGGRYEVEKEEIARFLRCPASKVGAIESALEELGRLSEGKVAKWASRQFTSDRSAARTKAYRERHRDGNVTSQERRGDAPELETETEVPLSKDNGAPVDSDTRFWADAKAYVGKPAMVGKWLRDHGKDETARAITAAQIERAVDPIPYIEGYFRKHGGGSVRPVVPL